MPSMEELANMAQLGVGEALSSAPKRMDKDKLKKREKQLEKIANKIEKIILSS